MHPTHRRAWHPAQLLMVLALWLATAGNLPLWRAVWHLPESTGVSALTTLSGLGGVVLGLLLAFLALLVWPRWLKPAGVLLLVHLLLGAVLPGLWWWRQAVQPLRWVSVLGRQLGLAGLGLVLALAVLWLDNQFDPERRARASVVVLHQMGCHGPACCKRSPSRSKPFRPECTSHALQKCPPEQLVNAHDNSIHYTDQVLANTVRWLQQVSAGGRPTAMVYVSDHGESLGEKGLYLHGMPYSTAPREQTHVPMLMWLSGSMRSTLGVRADCLNAQKDKPWSHDHFFSTVLALTRVRTSLYGQPAGVLSTCLQRPD